MTAAAQVIQGCFAAGAPSFAGEARAGAAPTIARPIAPHVQACMQRTAQRPALSSAILRTPAASPGLRFSGAGSAIQVPASIALHGRERGQSLAPVVRRDMEALFRADFSAVRVQIGPQAQQIGARAFTQGTTIYFAPGQYDPRSAEGRRLLGHELTHVLQQSAGRVRNPFGAGVAVVQEPALEAEADRMGMRAARLAPPAAVASPAQSAQPKRTAGPLGVAPPRPDVAQRLAYLGAAAVGTTLGYLGGRVMGWWGGGPPVAAGPPAPPLAPAAPLPPVVALAPVRSAPLVRIAHGARRRELQVQPNHYRTPREMDAYKAALANRIVATATAGSATVTLTRVRNAVTLAAGLSVPMVGADLDFGLYEIAFYTLLHPDDWRDISAYEAQYLAWERGGRYPGLRPALNRAPGGAPVRIAWQYRDRSPVRAQILATGNGQGAAEALNAEHAFRVALRDRFRTAARRPNLTRSDVFTNKFITDHLASTAMQQANMASNRADLTARYNHVIRLSTAGTNRALWEPIIDLVGSLNIAMAIRTGTDYRLPGTYDVAEYDSTSGRTTYHQAGVWVQFQPDGGIMKIHHLSGVEYTARGLAIYHGQGLNRAGALPATRAMRYLDVTHRDV